MKLKASVLFIPLILTCCLGLIRPAAAVASAVIQNDSMWFDPGGALHVLGEVKNTGDVWLKWIQVSVTLHDANGATVESSSNLAWPAKIYFVQPGGLAPFDIMPLSLGNDSVKASQVRTYSLTVTFEEAAPIPVSLVLLDVAHSTVTSQWTNSTWLQITGKVENQADATSQVTKVVGTFYAANGTVIYVTESWTRPNNIPPGARGNFTLSSPSTIVSNLSSEIAGYSLIAQNEYAPYMTSTPETRTLTTNTNVSPAVPGFSVEALAVAAVIVVIAVAVLVMTRRRRRAASRIGPTEPPFPRGPRAPTSLAPEKFCVNCGTRMPETHAYCRECGSKQS